MEGMMKINKAILIAAVCAISTGAVYAKLPVPQLTDEQKAKAEEAKSKAADAAKKDTEALTKSQDSVADRYVKAQKAKGIVV
jgi:glucose dehydrogenase